MHGLAWLCTAALLHLGAWRARAPIEMETRAATAGCPACLQKSNKVENASLLDRLLMTPKQLRLKHRGGGSGS